MPDSGESKIIHKVVSSGSASSTGTDIETIAQKRQVQMLRSIAFALMATYIGACGVTLASYFIQDISQMVVISVVSVVLVFALMGVFTNIKKDKLETAAIMLLVIAMIHLLAVNYALSGLFTVVVLSGMALIIIFSNLVLKGKWRILLTFIIIFVTLCIGMEFFTPLSRFDIRATPLADPVMIFVTVTLLIVLIALGIRSAQYSAIRTRLLISFTVTTILPGILSVGVIMFDNALGGHLIQTAMSAAWLIIMTTTIGIGLALIGALYTSRGISRPLNEMVMMAVDVSEGDLRREVAVDRVDEIGNTAIAFNKMTYQLRSIIGDLENRVSARTADLEQRTIQLETAVRISRQIAAVREVDTLLDLAVNETARRFEYEYVGLYLFDDKRQKLRLRAVASGTGEPLVNPGYQLDIDNDVVIAAAATRGNALIVSDYDTEEHFVRLPELPLIHSELALPLRIRDEIIGVFDIASVQPGNFGQQDATYLQLLGDQIALAIDNAMLLTAAEERLREIEHLNTSQSIQGWQNLAMQRPNWGYIYDGSRVLPTQQQTMTADDVDLTIALRSDRSELGEIKFIFPENQTWNVKDVALAQAIANEAGQALESARLYSESQDALQEVGVLYQAIQAIVSANTPDEVLSAFVDNLVTPGIDRCGLLMEMDTAINTEHKYARIEAAWDANQESSPLAGQVWDISQSTAMASNVHVIPSLADTSKIDWISKSMLLEKGFFALMIVPLGTGDDIFGWLLIGTQHSKYTFTERQIRLYSNFSDQITQALENIRLVQAAENRAREEQVVSNITQRIRETMSVDEILKTAVLELRTLLDLESVEIHLGETENSTE
jgi:GAF domain-containing protein/HAMP domain-containing protein